MANMRHTDVNWSRLVTCQGYSDPTLLPLAIERILSADAATRKKGYWGIENHAVVQGDLYSSAPYVARILVDSLNSGCLVTEELIDILFEFHIGASAEVLVEGPLAGRPIETICHEIVLEAKPRLTEELDSASADVKAQIAELLESLDETDS